MIRIVTVIYRKEDDGSRSAREPSGRRRLLAFSNDDDNDAWTADTRGDHLNGALNQEVTHDFTPSESDLEEGKSETGASEIGGSRRKKLQMQKERRVKEWPCPKCSVSNPLWAKRCGRCDQAFAKEDWKGYVLSNPRIATAKEPFFTAETTQREAHDTLIAGTFFLLFAGSLVCIFIYGAATFPKSAFEVAIFAVMIGLCLFLLAYGIKYSIIAGYDLMKNSVQMAFHRDYFTITRGETQRIPYADMERADDWGIGRYSINLKDGRHIAVPSIYSNSYWNDELGIDLGTWLVANYREE